MSGSANSINYQLVLNGNNIGAPVAGTNNAISFGNQTTAGTYTVIASDANNCTALMTGSTILNQSPNITTLTPTHVTSCTANNGSILITATGENLQYSIDGTTFQAANTFNNLAAGNYTITARNSTATACIATSTVSLNAPTAPTAGTISSDQTICSGNTVSFTGKMCIRDRV